MGALVIAPSLEKVVWRIAKAFLRQRYPLSEQGFELRNEIRALVASGKVPVKYIDILPTVENPRLELFADFNLTPEQELEVFGWSLSTIQTHKGCTHQCTFCYKNAGHRLTMMPFAAVAKIAKKKLEYEKRAVEEWLSWEKHLCESDIIDLREFWLPDFLEQAKRDKMIAFANMILKEWRVFSPKVLKVRPFLESMPAKALRKHYLHFVPVNYGSIHYAVFNYDDNDPLEYRDFLFLHRDGTPADYGDVFRLMSISLRPVSVTTAGWFSEDKIACRAMGKVIESCKEDPELDSKMHRISVSLYERHAIADPGNYLDEIERMIHESASLSPLLNAYYNAGDRQQAEIISRLCGYFDHILRKDLGVRDTQKRIMMTRCSFQYGRAVDLRSGEDYDTWDPDCNIDGIHIRPDGRVEKKPDSGWTTRRNKKGGIEYQLSAPEGSVPEPTGIQLYKLNGGGN